MYKRYILLKELQLHTINKFFFLRVLPLSLIFWFFNFEACVYFAKFCASTNNRTRYTLQSKFNEYIIR